MGVSLHQVDRQHPEMLEPQPRLGGTIEIAGLEKPLPKRPQAEIPQDLPRKKVRIQSMLEEGVVVRTADQGRVGATHCHVLPINVGFLLSECGHHPRT